MSYQITLQRQQLDINSLFDQVAAAASEFGVYFNYPDHIAAAAA